LTTELFIRGLNNKVFGPARERLILYEELQGSFIMGDTTYPSTWTIAASYFRLIVPSGNTKEKTTQDSTTALVANHDNQRHRGRRRDQGQRQQQQQRQHDESFHEPGYQQRSQTRSGTA
jgi:hypothetical protein